MAHELQRIDFEEFLADPQQVFEQVRRRGGAVLVERDGETYRLEQEFPHGIREEYDPEAARRGLHAAVGALDGVDIQELLSDLRAQRGQDSLGRPA